MCGYQDLFLFFYVRQHFSSTTAKIVHEPGKLCTYDVPWIKAHMAAQETEHMMIWYLLLIPFAILPH